MMHWNKFSLLILFSFWAKLPFAQINGLRSYGIQEGLTCDQISAIHIDDQDYIYISCEDSKLYRLDDQKFNSYTDSIYPKFKTRSINSVVKNFSTKYPSIQITCSGLLDQNTWIGTKTEWLLRFI